MKKIMIMFLMLTTIACAQTKKKENILKYFDFELPVVNSTETLKLSNIVGKKLVLLNFWATWCPYCVREIPDLKNVYEKYKDKGLEIVAVNIGESSKEVSKFVEIKEIKYKVVLDQKTQVARMYGVRGIPTNFLIGLDGNVIFADYVMPDEKIIEENLPKIPTPKPKKSKTEERR